MLRRLFLALSESERLRDWLVRTRVSRRAARRFVAGEELSQALEVTRVLAGQGIKTTLDHLGENTHTVQEAQAAAGEYLKILESVRQNGLEANVSLKLSQMGLEIDEELCYQNLAQIVAEAQESGSFVRIDMEGSDTTERTLRLYERLRTAGYERVGVVIQAYLRRSEADIRRLIARGASVRLCKGAYAELPGVAFASKHKVDQNYRQLLSLLLGEEAEAKGVQVAIATHDAALINWAKQLIQERASSTEQYEFQMLYGIRRDLQRQLAQAGYPVRVYVSYGQEWYPYFMRRLAERPANLFFLLRQLGRG
ncbi:MAG TPA: proline dehydrogenase [Candidatus Fraserbacteria bacterium]|nr:proline dehydrogenase [Candidatus Fraserbacteria bacterium]